MLKKVLLLIIFMAVVLNIGAQNVSAGLAGDFLLETGEKYYQQGNFKGALQELRKALLADPGHQGAQKLIRQIEAEQAERENLISEKEQRLSRKIEDAQKKLAQEREKSLELKREKERAQAKLKQLAAREAKKKQKISVDLDQVIGLLKKTQAGILSEQVAEERFIRKKEETEKSKPAGIKTEKEEITEEVVGARRAVPVDAAAEKVVIAEGEVTVEERVLKQEIVKVNVAKETVGARHPNTLTGTSGHKRAVPVKVVEKKSGIDIREEILPKACLPVGKAKKKIASQWVIRKADAGEITSPNLEQYRLFEEVKVFINGNPVEIAPIIIKDGDIWLPLEETAKAMGLVVFSAQKDSLTVINSQGTPLEFNLDQEEVFVNKKPVLVMHQPLAVYRDNLMLSLDSLEEALGVFPQYFSDTGILKIGAEKKTEFTVFAMEKPKAAIEEEKRIKAAKAVRAKPRLPREIREELLPQEYYPDIDLKVDATFRYFQDMLTTRRTRYNEYYLRGKMYGGDLFGRLSARDYETNDKRVFKEDGQHLSFFKDGKGIKLFDNFFKLPGVRTQSQSYWGVELVNKASPVNSYAWIGEMDPVYVSSLDGGGSVKYAGNLYAARQDWIDKDGFRLSAVELFTYNQREFSQSGGSTNYPRKNFVYLLDSDWQVSPQLNLYNTFAQSIYTPDNERDVLISDYDFKSGMKLKYDRFSVNSSFEYVGDRYASLGIPSTYQDYIGGNVGTNFKITDKLNLNVSGNISRDNVAFDETSPTSDSRGVSTSTNFRLPANQNVNLGWSYNRYLTYGGSEDASGNEYNNYRIDYYKTLKAASLQLGWQHYRMDPLASSSGSMLFDTYSATLYKSFPKLRGAYLRLYQDWTKKKELSPGGLPASDTYNTSLSAKYSLSPSLNLTGDCRLRRTEQEQTMGTSVLSFSTGLNYSFSPDTTLNLTYEVSNIDLHHDQSTKDWSFLFYVRRMFDFKTAEKWGEVGVYVFEDLNGNGLRDGEEKELENILAYIVGGRGVKTGSGGRALIKKVAPGERKVRLDMRGFPVDMVIKGKRTKEVTVQPLERSAVTFVVVTTGTIEGRIFVDTNGNAIFDKGLDIPLPNVRVFLTPEGKDTLSFSDGSYRFDYTYPGDYQVNLDLEWVPKDYKLVSPQGKDAEVVSKQTVGEVDFIFEGRPLKIKFF